MEPTNSRRATNSRRKKWKQPFALRNVAFFRLKGGLSYPVESVPQREGPFPNTSPSLFSAPGSYPAWTALLSELGFYLVLSQAVRSPLQNAGSGRRPPRCDASPLSDFRPEEQHKNKKRVCGVPHTRAYLLISGFIPCKSVSPRI